MYKEFCSHRQNIERLRTLRSLSILFICRKPKKCRTNTDRNLGTTYSRFNSKN